MKYDVTGLFEVKASDCVSLPGYVCYRNIGWIDGQKEGTLVSVRRCLQAGVMSVYLALKNQIWFKLSGLSNVFLGFVYVSPAVLQYFNPNSFGQIQEKIIS